jgi:polar amino acid transport system substrate-binding protein
MRRSIYSSILLSAILLVTSCVSNSSETLYTIARDPSWFPLFLSGKQDNVFAFSDDLLMKVMSIENQELDLVTGNWDNLLYNLWKGHYMGVLTSIAPTEANKALYDFSEEFLSVSNVLVVREKDVVTSLSDMKGKIVIVDKRGEGVILLERFPSINIRHYQEASKALQLLEQGDVDGVIMGILSAYTITQNLYKGVLKVTTPPLGSKALRLVTLKGKYPELIASFNQGLDKIQDDGAYYLMLRRWGLYQ